MNRVAIVAGVRTPIGKGGRAYAAVHPVDLLATVMSSAVHRAGVPAESIDQVLVGCTHQAGEQTFNIARNGWLAAGLPLSVPATTLDTQCGSSQPGANLAAGLIASGQAELVLAGGVESLSKVPLFSTWLDRDPYSATQRARYDMPHQGIASERVARKYGISREDADQWGFTSHRRAAAAWSEGAFAEQIVHVRRDGRVVLEGPIVATQRLLDRNELAIADLAHVELHEAFATPVCAWLSVFDADPSRVNPDGGAISIGHPFGASGARQLAHLAHSLSRRPGALGLQAMCAGGGIGTGTLLASAR